MEITWYGAGCVRLRGREGTVVADAYRSVVGPTGRGISGDIATYSHADPRPLPARGRQPEGETGVVRPTSLDDAFLLDGPGEYEVHNVLVTGVRTFRDDQRGAERGANVAFVYELDGLHAAHLGDLGHLLSEEMLGELGTAEVLCVPIGGSLTPARAAEVVAQLDASLVVPLPLSAGDDGTSADMNRFLHEMGVQHPAPQPRLVVTISSLPQETTLVLLESRAKA
jgi:L-ascorbate metabolism protein UlaG (beta-lactamase superfamily)